MDIITKYPLKKYIVYYMILLAAILFMIKGMYATIQDYEEGIVERYQKKLAGELAVEIEYIAPADIVAPILDDGWNTPDPYMEGLENYRKKLKEIGLKVTKEESKKLYDENLKSRK